MLCPCHSGKPYASCCAPYHRSLNAPTPLALMRSRYSAYSLGKAEYIIATTHPDHPDASLPLKERRQQIKQFSRNTIFKGLDILEATENMVTFRATLFSENRDLSFTEKSLFAELEGRWYYLGPLTLSEEPQ